MAVTIFTDSQAALRRIQSDEPGPGQVLALRMMRWESDILKRKIPVWWENPFLTTTAHIGRGGGARRYRDNGGGLRDGEYIYFGDPGVDREHLNIQWNTHSIFQLLVPYTRVEFW